MKNLVEKLSKNVIKLKIIKVKNRKDDLFVQKLMKISKWIFESFGKFYHFPFFKIFSLEHSQGEKSIFKSSFFYLFKTIFFSFASVVCVWLGVWMWKKFIQALFDLVNLWEDGNKS